MKWLILLFLTGFISTSWADPPSQEIVLGGPIDEAGLVEENELRALSVGINYLAPLFHFQQAISQRFTVGVIASIFDYRLGNGSIDGLGITMTLSYYVEKAYEGAWAMLGTGMYAYNAHLGDREEHLGSLVLLNAYGWRWLFASGLNFAVGAGVQYITNTRAEQFDLNTIGILPTLTIDIGFAF